ncbi:MAG: hypothetical protein OES24_09100 [Acidimicrobiia bacterium]|nr:hypothetical protein [Acidimicrobiia bacterium]
MHGREADGDRSRHRHGDEPPSGSCQPPSPTESARLPADLVAERLNTVAGPGLTVDAEGDVLGSPDRRWSAALAPLRSGLAHVPTDGRSLLVDRETERWRRARVAVERITGTDRSGHTQAVDAPIVLRLTSVEGVPGRTLRPAFGQTAWELVRDLGAGGLASLTAPEGPGDGLAEQVWGGIAAETVARHERRWGRLILDGSSGIILSGPHLSALLFDPLRLRDHVDDVVDQEPLQATVFTNSLLLVTVGDRLGRPTLDLVVESLRRFTSGSRRHFEPFTVGLPDRAT